MGAGRTAGGCGAGTARRRRGGFTLIELLAVLAILGVLMSVAYVAFGRQGERARVADTVAAIGQLELLIHSYQKNKGDWPPGSLRPLKLKVDNSLNEGIEACLAALHGKDHPTGASLPEKYLGNTDGDETSTPYHRDGVTRLLEAVDAWGNPIAYFSFREYGTSQDYRLSEEEERAVADVPVSAAVSETTGVFANADSFQLISAGPDGDYGTADDVTNLQR